MADSKNSPGAPAKSTFAESAARLNGVVQSVRAKQAGECMGTHCVTEYTISNFSPDEVWAKNFATYGIGPQFDARPFNTISSLAEPKHAAETSIREPMQMVERAPMKAQRARRSVLHTVLFGNRD